MPVFAPKSNLNSIFIPYFDWEGGLAQPVVTSFWPQIGPQLQTRMCAEQEKTPAHWVLSSGDVYYAYVNSARRSKPRVSIYHRSV